MRSCKNAAAGGGSAKRARARLRRSLAIAGLLLVLTPAAAPAQLFAPAEPLLPPGAVGLPPGAVRRIISAQGFRVLVPPFRNGDVYVVDVVDGRYGDQERLIVDAYEGTILRHIRVEARRRAPPPDTVVGDRLPFPDESDRRARPPRSAEYPSRSDNGGVFSLFSRPSAEEEQPRGEPRIVPGVGPERPKPKRVVKPKAPPRALVRAAPLPPADPRPALQPEPQAAPAAVEPQGDAARPSVRPEPPVVATAPLPEVKPAKPGTPPRAPAPPRSNEAAVAPVPPPSVRQETRPAPAKVTSPPPSPKAVDKAAPDAKPAARSAETAARPAKVSDTKRQRGPLNDIPPAPLE